MKVEVRSQRRLLFFLPCPGQRTASAWPLNTSQASLQRIMGHADPATTSIYQTLAAEHLKQQAAKFGKMIDKEACPRGSMDTDDNDFSFLRGMYRAARIEWGMDGFECP